MYRLIFLFFALFLFVTLVKAKERSLKTDDINPTEIESVDAISYDLYVKQDWKTLIKFSEKALKSKIDFYYLRMRIGIAYYEMKQYRMALHHFEAAYTMDKNDELLKEYLFYCYVYTEQYPQALKITNTFSLATLQKTKMEDPSPIYFANAEVGLKISSDTSLYKSMKYFQAGVGINLGRNVTAYIAFTNIAQPMYYGSLSQQQFFVTLNIPLKKSWLISPAFHYLNYTYSNVKPSGPPAYPGAPPPIPNYDGSSIVASIAISKSWKDFLFTGIASYSTLNSAKQYQQQLNVNWYPLHNKNLMLNGGVILFSDDSSNSFKPIPSIGGRYFITSKISLSASYTYFETKNFNEQNGYLVNNSDDITHQRINVGLDWNCGKNVSLFGHYLHESKTEYVRETNYNFNMGIIGLKLIF